MSWSFLIFSSKSPKEAQKIIDILEAKLEDFEDMHPTAREDYGCPTIDKAAKAKPENYIEELQRRVNLSDGDSLKLSEEICIRMKAAKSVVDIESFSLEDSPLGITVLKYLLNQLGPNIINIIDGWDKGEDFLGALSEFEAMGLDAEADDEDDDDGEESVEAKKEKKADVASAEEEVEEESPLAELQSKIFGLMERARRDMNARIEAEKVLKTASPLAQKLLNYLASSRNLQEPAILKTLNFEKDKLQKAFDELKDLFSKIKKAL